MGLNYWLEGSPHCDTCIQNSRARAQMIKWR